MKFKAQTQLNKKLTSSKTSKMKGIPKLDDANDAGTRNSRDCTLILTEGDSAKSLAVAGLGVVGRDKYGVFPLKGKVLNVREATHKQVSCISLRSWNLVIPESVNQSSFIIYLSLFRLWTMLKSTTSLKSWACNLKRSITTQTPSKTSGMANWW